MEKYLIFGAGYFGIKALNLLNSSEIAYFIDNNIDKQGTYIEGKEIISLNQVIEKNVEGKIIIAVSEDKYKEIEHQLDNMGVKNYITLSEYIVEETKRKLLERTNYLEIYRRAIQWIQKNSIKDEGIICNTGLLKSYPEVTGYFIPTLLKWGYKDLAIQYAKWLCKCQKNDGSWFDTAGNAPYIFDTAQILKGLIAIRNFLPIVDSHIIRGCDWILCNMTSEGRLIAPIENAWGDEKTFSEIIHVYCISPIRDAGVELDRNDYIEKAKKIAEYYTTKCRDEIVNFNLLSHFYAYVIEAMIDIHHEELAIEAMAKIASIQKESGAVPGYNNVDWVCSTGLFQLALVWFRLGDLERGNRAFEYACKLQNTTGGWYGSYNSEDNPNENKTYFPCEEISWANKYFLDALYYKNVAMFESQSSIFGMEIDCNDGRYKCIESLLENKTTCNQTILDVGCGKGRYIRNLAYRYPKNEYYAVDLSVNVMTYFDDVKVAGKKQGTLTNIPYEDNMFDVTYTCEALEHAVDVESAIKELFRVTKPGGVVAILDKNLDEIGRFEIEEWEQWFGEEELKNKMQKYSDNIQVIRNVGYEGILEDNLFYFWKGIKK